MDLLPTEILPTRSYREALHPWKEELAHKSTRFRMSTGAWRALGLLFDAMVWLGLFCGVWYLLQATGKITRFPSAPVMLVPLCISLLASWLVGAYDRESDFMSLRFASELFLAGVAAAFIGAALVTLVSNFGRGEIVSRLLLMAVPGAYTLIALITRRAVCTALRGNAVKRHYLVIGSQAEAGKLVSAMALTQRGGFVEHFDPADSGDDLASFLKARSAQWKWDPDNDSKSRPDSLILAPSAEANVGDIAPFLVGLHTTCIPVYTWGAFWQQRLRIMDVSESSAAWLFDRDFRLVQSSVYWHIKRLFDLVLATVLLVLSVPLLVFAWIAIRFDSPGSPLFCQRRVGFRGEEFTIYKFRTMREDSDKDGATTAASDPRVTRVGRFLRKSRIDEIPQLWNVLRGDMSFVGPRPEWTVCVSAYEKRLPFYHLRHLVKPGLTGWAQVNYPYGVDVDDARRKLAFDLYYVANASLVLDCTTVLKTLHVVMGRVGGR